MKTILKGHADLSGFLRDCVGSKWPCLPSARWRSPYGDVTASPANGTDARTIFEQLGLKTERDESVDVDEADLETLAPGEARAILFEPGDRLTLLNRTGQQVISTWAFDAGDPTHHLSMERTRHHNKSLFPGAGGIFYTNRNRPILRMVKDTSIAHHDTITCSCQAIGAENEHTPSCCNAHLRDAMARHGRQIRKMPQPMNVFRPIRMTDSGEIQPHPLHGQVGDYLTLEVLVPCQIVISQCARILANRGAPKEDAHFILTAAP